MIFLDDDGTVISEAQFDELVNWDYLLLGNTFNTFQTVNGKQTTVQRLAPECVYIGESDHGAPTWYQIEHHHDERRIA